MPITKKRTRRELAETVFERGKHRPIILEIWDGTAYAWPKGLPNRRVQVSIAGSWQHAQTVHAAIPRIRAARRKPMRLNSVPLDPFAKLFDVQAGRF